MLTLPPELRDALKEPFGPVYTDAETLLADAGRPIVAVGDVVTYHLRQAGHDPHVAVVDGVTKREAVSEEIENVVTDVHQTGSDEQARTSGSGYGEHRVDVVNAPAELSRELLIELREAVRREENTLVLVEGEEDLATLPAILATPLGGAVVYGQPDEGMVLVEVTEAARAEIRDLLVRFDGDADAALAVLGL